MSLKKIIDKEIRTTDHYKKDNEYCSWAKGFIIGGLILGATFFTVNTINVYISEKAKSDNKPVSIQYILKKEYEQLFGIPKEEEYPSFQK